MSGFSDFPALYFQTSGERTAGPTAKWSVQSRKLTHTVAKKTASWHVFWECILAIDHACIVYTVNTEVIENQCKYNNRPKDPNLHRGG